MSCRALQYIENFAITEVCSLMYTVSVLYILYKTTYIFLTFHNVKDCFVLLAQQLWNVFQKAIAEEQYKDMCSNEVYQLSIEGK